MSLFFYRQLAKAAQKSSVEPGQMITVKVDLTLGHDGTGPAILQALRAIKPQPEPAACSRVLFTLDHAFPAPTIKDREFQRDLAGFAERHHLLLYKNGEGVLHQVVAEEESLWPGMIIVGADGHVATAGAFGAIAFSVSPSAFVPVFSSGSYQITVPEQLVVCVTGDMASQVTARDLAMHIVRHHGAAVKDRAVVLTGDTIDRLSISEKMAICNFLPEGGVSTAFVLPQGEQAVCGIEIAAEAIRPLVVLPGEELLFAAADSLTDQRISVVIIGGCSSGRLDDMKMVADILSKNGVHRDVTCIVTPASRNVLESMDTLKLSAGLRNAGAVVMSPGCGPCPGRHFGVLSDDDTAITTTIRSNPGRIGAKGAKIFLASPLTAAWSAAMGRIVSPGVENG